MIDKYKELGTPLARVGFALACQRILESDDVLYSGNIGFEIKEVVEIAKREGLLC